MARDLKYFGKDLMKMSKKARKLVKTDLPRVVAVEGKNHFTRSWRNQGFEDSGITKWRARKPPKRTTKTGKVSSAYQKFQRKEGRQILYSHRSDLKGTHLKDSIRARAMGTRVLFQTNKVYAQVHNEGGRAGRGKGFRMPRRQFMGQSRALENKIGKKIDRMVDALISKQ